MRGSVASGDGCPVDEVLAGLDYWSLGLESAKRLLVLCGRVLSFEGFKPPLLDCLDVSSSEWPLVSRRNSRRKPGCLDFQALELAFPPIPRVPAKGVLGWRCRRALPRLGLNGYRATIVSHRFVSVSTL